ncbi:hypothetical protein ABZ816_31320 [Actinosynnema sp. NPDC047251]|uniref:Uncharacterized protein n=1 Tax=Saccharothrix espanaensis (strain ATCC 51144 / DSM 44229 / JCM 9112 / NBRC 15066 / NRRL 15764) TaxID=1179773 RepID=K0K7L4_SACES|nr:hypothetical protein [Saccharothrix espanaensis]CCH32884.1 hypothetical protein BN6_56250 [Saccharothrix espanaensis DSM 44229]
MIMSAKVPVGHTVTSLLGLGPMPFTKIVKSHELVAESNRTSGTRPDSDLTNLEDGLRRAVETRAERAVRRSVAKRIDPLAEKINNLHAEVNVVCHQITAQADQRYVGPHGESLNSTETTELHRQYSRAVADDSGEGAVVHRRTTPESKRAIVRLLALDIFVLTFLMMKFLNVDFTKFWQTPGGLMKAGTAVLFGVLGTIGVALGMKAFGRRHRAYRRPDGNWDFSGGSKRVLITELSVAIGLVLAVAGAMAWRFILDGEGGDQTLTVIMAILFALITGAVAYLSYLSEFADGSLITEAIDVLAPQLHGARDRLSALAKRRSVLLENADRLFSRIERTDVEIRLTAVRTVLTSPHDKAIRYARSLHQRTGASGSLPEPRLDLAALDLATDQTRRLAENQADLRTVGDDLGDSGLVVVR